MCHATAFASGAMLAGLGGVSFLPTNCLSGLNRNYVLAFGDEDRGDLLINGGVGGGHSRVRLSRIIRRKHFEDSSVEFR
jgi:hypothetical protein